MRGISNILGLAIAIAVLAVQHAVQAAPTPAVAAGIPLAFTPPLRAEGRDFVDAENRVVILRGFNVAGRAKIPPFRSITDPSQLDPLPKWGVNAVRLLFTWEAYEGGGPGKIDDGYMQYYLSLIDELYKRGIATIVDLHQDSYSRWINGGCGDGFPEWTNGPDITKKQPKNDKSCSSWGSAQYLDGNFHSAWDSFWKNKYGARSAFLAMLKRVATATAHRPGVIGFDLINEPTGDEIPQFVPFYRDAAAVVRAIHPTTLLFLEPAGLTASGLTGSKLNGDGLRDLTNIVYAPHFYDPTATAGIWLGVQPGPTVKRYQQEAAKWGPTIAVSNSSSVVAAGGVPMLVGEFGAPEASANYIRAFYDGLDANFASAMQWQFEPLWDAVNKDGWNVEDFSVFALNKTRRNFVPRPYLQAVTGIPILFTISGTTISVQWTQKQATSETLIHVPNLSASATVTSTGAVAAQCTVDVAALKVRCKSTGTGKIAISIQTK
ncbi:glycoside hydrolase superfamily [Fimicolochytrium jonesii]|uniref:glycoside hydrolase superfamily n=1 Tax=Fimicolochytrium jonesii TaxID=1396493 RepID=UPI0022FF2ACD|nr:glycoside hydrolase superfamily [Fimicolochytrium jonesii]KAI8825863.1 glycoside hydrolase superfamily [Fimicolochytrium jonesii]